MKYILLSLTITFCAGVSFAKGKFNLEEKRARVTAHIDKKITIFNELKTCISKATEKKDFKDCKAVRKSKMRALKSEMRSARKK